MRLTEQIDIKAVSVVGFGCKPRKAAQKRQASAKRRSKGRIPEDKKGKIGLRLETPLTRVMAELLESDGLLYEAERDVPRDGYKRLTLDVDFFSNVRVQVKNKEPNAALDVIADRLERWVVVDKKGVGPVLQWDLKTTGYISQLADFVSAIDNALFVVTCSPAQASLGFETATATNNKGQMPDIYRVT